MNVCTSRNNQGLILIAVLWMTLALAVLVSSISTVQKNSYTDFGIRYDLFKEELLLDSALNFFLVGEFGGNAEQPRSVYSKKPLSLGDGRDFEVEIFPISGLINIRTAKTELLEDLFKYGVGLGDLEAKEVAENVVSYRYEALKKGEMHLFGVPEDILKVPNFRFRYFERIAGMISTDPSGDGLVALDSAPLDVLRVVLKGNTRSALKLYQERPGVITMPESESVGRFKLAAAPQAMRVVRAKRVNSVDEVSSKYLRVRVWWIVGRAADAGKESMWTKYWTYGFHEAAR